MAKNDGTSLTLTLDAVAIDNLTDVGLTCDNVVIDCTSFDSAGNREILMGTSSWNMTASAHVDGADSENFNEAFASWTGKSSVAVLMVNGTPVTGDASLAGTGYISNITKTGEIDSVVSYSITIEGTGALVNTPTV